MNRLLVAVLLATVSGLALNAGPANARIIFQETFDNRADWPNTTYNFDARKFGYSDNPITTRNDPSGGVNGGGAHVVPLGPAADGTYLRNFDVHFGKMVNNLSEYYVQFYVWVNRTFPEDGENWKLTYNYYPNGANFVMFHAANSDGRGYQPTFFRAGGLDIGRTEPVQTLYLRNYKEQWICYEYFVSIPTNTLRLWVTTANGDYNETLYINTNQFTHAGPSIVNFKVGAYWDGTGSTDYFKLDNVTIADEYIGCRANPRAPSPPTNAR